MACNSAFSIFSSADPWLGNITCAKRSSSSCRVPLVLFRDKISSPRNCGVCTLTTIHDNRYNLVSNCVDNGDFSSSSDDDREPGPTQDALLKALTEVSKAEGRVSQATIVVLGGTVKDNSSSEWLDLDNKVNSYPTVRRFTAIGIRGDDFVKAMIYAVESVLQKPIPKGRVKEKISSGGNYVSVKIGPVPVSSGMQVQAVYKAMKRDSRIKYFL